MDKEKELLLKEELNKRINKIISEYEERDIKYWLEEKIKYIYSICWNGYFYNILYYLREKAIQEKNNLEKNFFIHVFLHQIAMPTMELNEKQICWKNLLGKIENESEETINLIYEALKLLEWNNTFIF